jgi:hypothetical protein
MRDRTTENDKLKHGSTKVYVGAVFGKLTVIKYAFNTDKQKYWECLCECGTVKNFRQSQLIAKMAQSCGCSHYRRGGKAARNTEYSRTYSSWDAMHKRCDDPKHIAFHRYGGAGITICARWHRSNPTGFDNFLEDMGLRPENTSLDRIDGTLGYSSDNCRWTTRSQQQRNTSTNRFVTWQGETKTLVEWSEDSRLKEKNITYQTLNQRLLLGTWTIEEMMTTPNLGRRRRPSLKTQNCCN